MADISTSHLLPLCHCVIGKSADTASAASNGSQFDLVNFVSTIAWPVVALILLLAYRDQISSIAKRTLPNVTRVSFGSFALELSESKAQEAKIQYSDNRMDYRKSGTAAHVIDSTSAMFREQLEASDKADYAVVDLGRGNEWLDSRLFILSVLMAELRGIRAIVFLESVTDARRSFVGVADAGAVYRNLGAKLPWLEEAYRRAMTTIPEKSLLEVFAAQQVLSNYLTLLQKQQGIANLVGNPPLSGGTVFSPEDFEDEDGVLVSDPDDPPVMVEHASWLNGDRLESLLGDDLDTSSIRKSELRGLSEREKVGTILSEPGPFIAITRRDNRLEDLIVRKRLMDHVCDHFLNEQDGAQSDNGS
ncbi:hypothetical protein [Ruegeria profundi]|uniref:hypothetical protein n=1 Tax=Ruegeria profundi TaxID=1685378 RepID=UPI003C7C346B